MSTPNGWDEALVAAGFIDRRSGKGPSWTALAEEVGKHPSTLTAMKEGTRRTDQATIDAVAEALHLDSRLIAKWAGRARSERDPYKPPPEANLLDRDEREAINRMIALLARPRIEEVSNAGQLSKDQKSSKQQDPERTEGGSDDRQSDAQKSEWRGSVTRLPERREYPGTQQQAANHGTKRKKSILADQDMAGEENQDPGNGWDDLP